MDALRAKTERMEELQDINFLATIEGQDYEESLRKIVSIFYSFHSKLNFTQQGLRSFDQCLFPSQGFTQLHFTPLETLAIIEGVQKRVGKMFYREEIESGILEEILIEEDYNLDCVVSFTFERVCF